MSSWPSLYILASGLALGLPLVACSGGAGGSKTSPVSYTIGGGVSGLWGTGLVLQDNGADSLTINANGNFTFSGLISAGAVYNVAVSTQPPDQTCATTNGSGTANSNVMNIQVACSSAVTYTIGGSVSGLTGSGLGLQDNGRDNLSVSGDGTFTFATPAPGGGSYNVTVYQQPPNQICPIANGSGTANANVTTIQVNCTSSESVLYTFGQAPDGNYPAAALVFDGSGNLYGTTEQGGLFGYGTVFRLTPNSSGPWTETILYSFCKQGNCADGATSYSSLIFDAAGNLYGTTYQGGAYGHGVVFELSPQQDGTWTETVLHSFGNGTDGAGPLAALVFDKAGNLYGTTSFGGATVPAVCPDTCGTVFELLPEGGGQWTEKVIYTFCSQQDCADGATPSGNLIVDSVGNLYGTTQSGGVPQQHTNGTVFELTPGQGRQWSETVLYSFQAGSDGLQPQGGLVQDKSGNLYGTTEFGGAYGNNGTVFEVTSIAGGKWTESLVYQFDGSGGSQPLAGLAFDKARNMYGTTWGGGDSSDGVVFEVTPQGGATVFTFEGAAQGFNPHAGVILDASWNLYGAAYQGGPFGTGVLFEIMRPEGTASLRRRAGR